MDRRIFKWRKGRQVFDCLLLLLLVLFRITLAPRDQGCRATPCELREPCKARELPDQAAFKDLHHEIPEDGPDITPCKGHRRRGKLLVFRIARNASPGSDAFIDADINDVAGEDDPPDMRTNSRNGLRPAGRIMADLSRCMQRQRPGRSHPRASKQPRSNWTPKSAV